MTSLVLVRHAKSDWGDASLDDHDRPLNERGRRDAPSMAQRWPTPGFAAEVILSSTALRARTTAAALRPRRSAWTSRLDAELYGAPASDAPAGGGGLRRVVRHGRRPRSRA